MCCCSYDTNKDKFIDFAELKHMMEKLGSAQTHLALKEMIREVDEDKDNKISFREVSPGQSYHLRSHGGGGGARGPVSQFELRPVMGFAQNC